jgi:hypothetical protein
MISYRIHFPTEFKTGRNFRGLYLEFSGVRRSFSNLCLYFDLAVSENFALSEVLLFAALDTQYIELSILGLQLM